MSKVMSTTGARDLFSRIAGEYAAKNSVYGIPEEVIGRVAEIEAASKGFDVFGRRVSLPVGPAAGPHTQIAPGIVAAFLCGARVFELKTVQENDALDIEKPCIDALDEGHNVEWSTELSLDDARGEYLRAWIAVHALEAMFSRGPRGAFMFNMSVGYTLDGIKGAKVDAFIEGLRAPASGAAWRTALAEANRAVGSKPFAAAFGSERTAKAAEALASIPSSPVHSVTLSTMHGCPPEEIERIGAYLIEEKGIDTYVKLNPTLLGYDEVRDILDAGLWRDIEISREGFERDLRFSDALSLIESLSARAKARGIKFGVKLSNTLANANPGGRLPGAERYMSGRALFPITVRLAARLAAALPDPMPLSFCGGVSARNAADCVRAGLGPLTVATEILKPGGYLRLAEIAYEAARALPDAPARPDAAALARLADEARGRDEYRADAKEGSARIAKALPLFDCFAAPCVEACPVNQKAPEYIRLAAAADDEAALRLVLADNPLPHVTGTLCDHVCQRSCSRCDYEGAVRIRDVKLACARSATVPPAPVPRRTDVGKVAVIGCGPAGLSCAHHLASAGFPVVVFDRARDPGGVPANVIPRFRIEREALAADIERIRSLGATVLTDERVDGPERLKAAGFDAVFIATGADVARDLPLAGSGVRVVDALEFLEAASNGGRHWEGVRRVMVAGGGNTAMDAARAALRIRGVEEVRLSYRRTVAEMPADREELSNAVSEGAILMELTLPERLEAGRVSLRRMTLGPRDPSGRRAPVPSDAVESIECDLLVAAIGETPNAAFLAKFDVAIGKDGKPVVDTDTLEARTGVYVGGDARRGPASIIAAAADGRTAAYAIMRKRGIVPPEVRCEPRAPKPSKLARRGVLLGSLEPGTRDFVERESERCLECDAACLRCVEVCPNRANVFVETGSGQAFQILHVDALCNECGNCGFFCPWEGDPCRGKPTLFADSSALEASANAGFAFDGDPERPELTLRALPEGEAKRFSWREWRDGVLQAESRALADFAAVVHDRHRYLLGGVE